MKTKSKNRNFVAKHAKVGGAGPHVAKTGEKAPRNRQKNAWKRALSNSLI